MEGYSSHHVCVCVCVCYHLILKTTRFCYPEELSMDEMECEKSKLQGFSSRNISL